MLIHSLKYGMATKTVSSFSQASSGPGPQQHTLRLDSVEEDCYYHSSGEEDEEEEGRFGSMSLDDLDIIKTIGIGTFGKVVLSQDVVSESYYALKVLSLFDILHLKQGTHVRNEKEMLLLARGHPFIVNLLWTGKDAYNVYLLMEYASGGELFSYLRSAGSFSPRTSSFYAAEIVVAVEYLHSKNIGHRDLKPENLLLDADGHLKITDFGFAKQFRDKTRTLCGTPEYLAPEVLSSLPYTKAVDWWALGILLHEMILGYSPFYSSSSSSGRSTYDRILSGVLDLPEDFDPKAKDLVQRLLVVDVEKRLGAKSGAEEIKGHKFFRDYDWGKVVNRQYTPPIIPKIFFPGDTRNFSEYPDTWSMQSVTEEELDLFADF